MCEGPSFGPSALEINHDVLKKQHQQSLDEIKRLRSLLDQNAIAWTKSEPQQIGPPARSRSTRKTSTIPVTRSAAARLRADQALRSLPHLPNEIILRILSLSVTQTTPLIDPFWKMRSENITLAEKLTHPLNVAFLATNKALRAEGIKLLISNNEFVFTQVEALQNFANYQLEARASISHVTLRIVAKYFDDTAYRKTLRGNFAYHSLLSSPTVNIQARPLAFPKDKGIQSYSWQQVLDFLRALTTREGPWRNHSQLLPNLKSMRIDLVNFCEHLPSLGSPFVSTVRWHVGRLLEELILTGAPDEEWSEGEERWLSNIVKDEGLYGTGCPVFVTTKGDRLKVLPGYGLNLQVMRIPSKPSEKSVPTKTNTTNTTPEPHPEGGLPPKSRYGANATIWKWTTDSLSKPEKKWIEFHRKCGLPVDDCGELQAIRDDDEDIDLDGLFPELGEDGLGNINGALSDVD
jgi:hypothetical protein